MSSPDTPLIAVTRETCVNPFCDGYGNIDISPSITGGSWSLGACKVGPHPPVAPDDYYWPSKRVADAGLASAGPQRPEHGCAGALRPR